jgi:hypothetical protein
MSFAKQQSPARQQIDTQLNALDQVWTDTITPSGNISSTLA